MPEEPLHDHRIPLTVRVGERVQVRGGYPPYARELRLVDLRDVHELVQAEEVEELREHLQVGLRTVGKHSRLELLLFRELLDLVAGDVLVDDLREA